MVAAYRRSNLFRKPKNRAKGNVTGPRWFWIASLGPDYIGVATVAGQAKDLPLPGRNRGNGVAEGL
ncbi:MAG: hypothetical protein DYG96_05230 [Chlorobi bacterium CHB2]|nr:hypothetical protein [Chlorobi bacterium CHB2]